MKIDELLEQSRRDAERSRELEERAAAGTPAADEEEAFVRALLDAGKNDGIVEAVAATRTPAARRRRLIASVALVAAPLALAAGFLLYIGRGDGDDALPAYALSTGGADAPVRGAVVVNGGELSEGAFVTVTAIPEHAVRAPVAARAFARCDGSGWSEARGPLTVAASGAVRFAASRHDTFGATRGTCELAIVLAREGRPLLAPDAGATTVLTARFDAR